MKARSLFWLAMGCAVAWPAAAWPQGVPPAPRTALEIRGHESLGLIWTDGSSAKPGSPDRARLMDEYLARSAPFVARYPKYPDVWLHRAEAALERGRRRAGWEAGRQLSALGLDDSVDESVQHVFAELDRAHWLGAVYPQPGLRLVTGAAPAGAGAERRIAVGRIHLLLEWIPAGTFRMGDQQFAPATTVHVSRGFWLGKYDVTQTQWSAVTGVNPSYFKGQGPNAPVEEVSWDEATAYCRKLDQAERAAGRLPGDYEIRLPTEAEWEYACRAGTTGAYGGDGVIAHLGWTVADSGGHPHPVGEKLGNAWGLYDMHGNVWEWCLDWFGNYAGDEVFDPAGPATGTIRVDRGGGWFNGAAVCQSAMRSGFAPGVRYRGLGLRVALAPKVATSP